MACGVQLSGLVISNTYFHFYKLGITLNALGILPDLYVANIFPIYPYTLLTYGLSKLLLFASFNFYYNFYYQFVLAYPFFDDWLSFCPNPSILRILTSASVALYAYFLLL